MFDPGRTYIQSIDRQFKPVGLWLSVVGDRDWKEWCEAEEFGLGSLTNSVDFDIADAANILVIDNPDALVAFHCKYRVPALYGSRYEIEWVRVAREYDGIIIAPYQYSLRLDHDMLWYYTRDCASGCIWNLKAITVKHGTHSTTAA